MEFWEECLLLKTLEVTPANVFQRTYTLENGKELWNTLYLKKIPGAIYSFAWREENAVGSAENIFKDKGGRTKKSRLFRGHVPYHGGGGHSPTAKKGWFFQTNDKNIQHALKKKTFFFKTIFN